MMRLDAFWGESFASQASPALAGEVSNGQTEAVLELQVWLTGRVRDASALALLEDAGFEANEAEDAVRRVRDLRWSLAGESRQGGDC